MADVPFRDHVWPKFLRENALRVFKIPETIERATGKPFAGCARSEVLGQEPTELDAHLGVLRSAEEPTVGHRLPHVQLGVDARVAQLAVMRTAFERNRSRVPPAGTWAGSR